MSDLPLIVFDVNETLLDLRTMEPTFKRIFGDKVDMRLWFADLVMYSLAPTAARAYVPFGAAVLKMRSSGGPETTSSELVPSRRSSATTSPM
jgi:2-haloacid dehalogenase